MGTFPEADARLFDNVYVCRKCENKTKVPISKFLAGKAVCRNCGHKGLRAIRKISKK